MKYLLTKILKSLWLRKLNISWKIVLLGIIVCSTTLEIKAQQIIRVDINATAPMPDGSDWAKAYADLQKALEAAKASLAEDTPPGSVQIWVAKGTYKPGIERFESFELQNKVELYGGFNGTETEFAARDFNTHRTVLSGDIGMADDSTDNSYHVLTGGCMGTANTCDDTGIPELDNTSILDGFTIKDGNADDQNRHQDGGAIYLLNSSPIIRNCIFENNSAKAKGGAIYVTGNPTLENNIFSSNSCDGTGGAIYTDSDFSILDCTFSLNTSIGNGGAIFVGKNLMISNSTFELNFSSDNGGAIRAEGDLTISNCLFKSNSSIKNGGAIHAPKDLSITNSDFFLNSTTNNDGGAIYFTGSTSTVSRSEFRGNQANSGKGGAIFSINSTIDFINCLFSSNVASKGGGGINVQSGESGGELTFTNCTLVANKTIGIGSPGGGINNESMVTTLNIENCILWHNEDNAGTNTSLLEKQANGTNTKLYTLTQGLGAMPDDDQNYGGDPHFVNPIGPEKAPSVEGNFNLNACASPNRAIDKGDNNLLPDAENLSDLNGNPRVFGVDDIGDEGNIVDRGAYEVQSRPVRPTIGDIRVSPGTIDNNRVTICLDTELTLSVTNDTTLSYQWWQVLEPNANDSMQVMAGDTNVLTVSEDPPSQYQYYLIATNSSGCSSRSDSIIIARVDSPDVTVSVNGNGSIDGNMVTSCNGSTLNIVVPEGAESYQWYIKNGNGTALIPNETNNQLEINDAIGAGEYYVIATVSGGCQSLSKTLIVSRVSPPMLDSLIVSTGLESNDSLPICLDTELTLSVTNDPDLTYQWWQIKTDGDSLLTDENSEKLILNEALAGNYQYYLTATNASGCGSRSETITVQRIAAPDFTPTVNSLSCIEAKNGTIALSVDDVTKYNFSLTRNDTTLSANIEDNQVSFDSLSVGDYVLGIELILNNTENCMSMLDTIPLIAPNSLAIEVTDLVHDCARDSMGRIVVSATGGSGAYEYSTTSSENFTDNGGVFDSLRDNSYTIYVKDANTPLDLCPTANITQEIKSSTLTFDTGATSFANDCLKNGQGSINITALQGIGDYIFTLKKDTVATSITNITGIGDFRNLEAGVYSIEVNDQLNCPVNYPATFSIQAPDDTLAIQVVSSQNIECSGEGKGSFSVSITGGVALDTLFITPNISPPVFQQNSDVYLFDSLSGGSYEIFVTDTLGCKQTETQTIDEAGALVAFFNSPTDVSCNGESSGGVQVRGFGGTLPYSYALLPESPTSIDTIFSIDGVFNSLEAGTYTFQVQDSAKCKKTVSVSISEPTVLGGVGINQENVVCNGQSTGKIQIKGLGGTPGYTYAIGDTLNFQEADSFVNLLAGGYNFWVKDANGCISPDPVKIDILQPDPSVPTSTFSSNTSFCQNGAPIEVSGTGIFANGIFNIGGPIVGGTVGNQMFNPSLVPIDSNFATITLIFSGMDNTSNMCPFTDTIELTVNAPPTVNLVFLDTAAISPFCKINENFELKGNPLGGIYDGNGVLGEFYNPSLVQDDQGSTHSLISIDHTISYLFTDSITGCSNTDSINIRANPLPTVGFSTTTPCVGQLITFVDTAQAGATSGPIISWNWNFGDGTDSLKMVPGISHTYTGAGKFPVSLTVTDNVGCSNTQENLITVGSNPDASFTWDKAQICLGDSVAFLYKNDENSEFEGKLISWQWEFGDGNDSLFVADTSETFVHPDTLKHFYSGYETYTVSLNITTDIGCVSTDTQSVFVLNKKTLPTDSTYFNNFNQISNDGKWIPEGVNSSWMRGIPSTNKLAINSPDGVWITSVDTTYNPSESSWVNSPCFDLGNLKRPMIRMQIFPHTDLDIDGAVLQVMRLNTPNPSWENVGELRSGINWYNSQNINGNPGDQGIQPQGWSGLAADWCESRHLLDTFVNSSAGLRFRVAFGSALDKPSLDGFAFDNVWIGNRPKKALLVEHFTNGNSATAQKARKHIENLFDQYSPTDSIQNANLIPLEYHTHFPDFLDPFHQAKPGPTNARALYYKIPQANYAVLDGNVLNQPTDSLSANLLNLRLLNDPNFGFELTTVFDGDNIKTTTILRDREQTIINCVLPPDTATLTVDTILLAEQEIVLFHAILARQLQDNGTTYEFVHMGMLPDAGGEAMIFDVDSVTNINNWSPNAYSAFAPFVPGNDLDIILVSWLQNYQSGEIYQVAIAERTILKSELSGRQGLIPNDDEWKIYPNPVHNSLSIQPGNVDFSAMSWELLTMHGALIYQGRFAHSGDAVKINTASLAEGMYLLSIRNQGQIWKQKKIIVKH